MAVQEPSVRDRQGITPEAILAVTRPGAART